MSDYKVNDTVLFKQATLGGGFKWDVGVIYGVVETGFDGGPIYSIRWYCNEKVHTTKRYSVAIQPMIDGGDIDAMVAL